MVKSKIRECPKCKSMYYGDRCEHCGYERKRKVQRTVEEKARALAEKEVRRKEREEKRAAKELAKAEKRIPRSEAELVRHQAQMLMRRQESRDHENHHASHENRTNKSLWMDTQFYFSVVFESEYQKTLFLDRILEKFKVPEEACTQMGTLNVINGLVLAKYMGIELKKEIAKDFPVANMELRNLILDYEKPEE